jgi:aerobic carbon-monoxide dehydrogenase medium subunit
VVPELIIDIKKIPETRAILRRADSWSIGAAVTGAELSEHPGVKQDWPGVVEAFDLIGSTQIQGRATLGGNLCNASPAADSVPALIAAGCRCLIAGPQGEREAAVEDIVISPGRTSLRRGEFIVSFTLPLRTGRSADAYLRLIPRTEMDIAVVGAGVYLSLDDTGHCQQARVALGAVAPAAVSATDAARLLIGSRLDAETMKRFATAVKAACRPINDKRGTIEYRMEVASVLAVRAAGIAWQRATDSSAGACP